MTNANQKGFAPIIIILIIVGVLAVGGGVWYYLVKTTTIIHKCTGDILQEIRVCPDGTTIRRIEPNCDFAACPGEETQPPKISGPLDTALAEITVLSVNDKIANIRVEKIIDYVRYPKATYPALKIDDKINIKITFVAPQSSGGTKSEAGRTGEPYSEIELLPEVGKKYLVSMSLCIRDYIGGLSCEYEGWSGALYQP